MNQHSRKQKKTEIAKQQGKPLLLEEAMSLIVDTKYLTGEDYILEMNSVDTWFTESNGIFGFILVASILVLYSHTISDFYHG